MKFLVFALLLFVSSNSFAVRWENCPFGVGQNVKPTQRVELKSLISQEITTVNSDQFFIVTSVQWKPGDCVVKYQNKSYSIDPNFLHAWDSTPQLSKKILAAVNKNKEKLQNHEYRNSLGETIDDVCPLAAIKMGQKKWNLETVAEVIAGCSAGEVTPVPRMPLANRCPPHLFQNQDLTDVVAWEGCPAPHECSDIESLALDKIESLSKELDHFTCVDRNAKKVAEIKAELANLPSPVCLTKFKLPPVKLVVHHSALSSLMGPDVIQRSHIEYREFSDIGYHYIIAQTHTGKWRLFEGRPIQYVGAQAGAGLNQDSIGVVIAGNYHASQATAVNPTVDEPLPPPEALILLEGILSKLKKEYPIQEIYTHHEIKLAGTGCVTECPAAGPTYMTHMLEQKFLSMDVSRK